MGEPQRDAKPAMRALRDDLLEVLGRKGVRQLPRLGGAHVQAGGVFRSSHMEADRRLARQTGRRLRLRGIIHRAASARLGRGLPRLVALDQRPSAGRAVALPGQHRDVAAANEDFIND